MKILRALSLICIVPIVGFAQENKHDALEKSQNEQVKTFNLSGVPLKMIQVKAGKFMMGSPDTEAGRHDNETRHEVTLTLDFWLGETEVTQGQWKAVMGDNPSGFKKDKNAQSEKESLKDAQAICEKLNEEYKDKLPAGFKLTIEASDKFSADSYPVEQVSWEKAMEFCEKLNGMLKEQLPDGYKFSLPTEAQWEYACRAGTTTELNNGKTLAGNEGQSSDLDKVDGKSDNLDEVGWYWSNSEKSTHPVAQKKPNAWGFYDMHGNVWEWCSDWYGRNLSDKITDPQGPSDGLLRIIRGGSCLNSARRCRGAFRGYFSPTDIVKSLGFRLAIVPVPGRTTAKPQEKQEAQKDAPPPEATK